MSKLIMLVFLTVAAISGCDGTSAPKANDSANRKDEIFIKNLSAAIKSSDRVVVTEHSNQFDFDQLDIRSTLDPQEVLYGTKDLSHWQTFLLKTIVTNASAEGSGLYSFCTFQPHHTIYFYKEKQLLNKLEICFECGDVLLPGTTTSSRPSLISLLSSFIEYIGFQPKRDWKSLAKVHKK